jgi:DNA-binding transcriptional LysR family regulator
MELRHLRYFVAVAEEENVTKAAALLHVSQPPLSRQIRVLENELGIELFERTAKSLHLTEAGRVFYQEARAVLQRADEAVATVRALATDESGELNIGYAPSLTVEILPRALRQFQEENPGVRVNLHDLSTMEMLAGLRAENLDAALMASPSKNAVRGLSSTSIKSYATCVAASPVHPLSEKKKIFLGEIIDERFIAYKEKEYPEYAAWIKKLFSRFEKLPGVCEEHDSVTSLIAAVESGRGIAIVSASLACMSGDRLKLVPVSPAPKPLVVSLVIRKRMSDTRLKGFVEAVLEFAE